MQLLLQFPTYETQNTQENRKLNNSHKPGTSPLNPETETVPSAHQPSSIIKSFALFGLRVILAVILQRIIFLLPLSRMARSSAHFLHLIPSSRALAAIRVARAHLFCFLDALLNLLSNPLRRRGGHSDMQTPALVACLPWTLHPWEANVVL